MTRESASTLRRSLRAPPQPIDTWSSCMALLGIESTLAGVASRFISETIPAAVYWAIIRPESVPGSSARKGKSVAALGVEEAVGAPLAHARDVRGDDREEVQT